MANRLVLDAGEELLYWEEMLMSLKKYREGNDVVSLDHLQMMIEDSIKFIKDAREDD